MSGHRYDRTGERLEVDEDGLLYVHPAGCDEGWITVDGQLAIVRPCPRCRPETLARLQERKAQ